MPDARPRLIIEHGAEPALEQLRRKLGDRYDIIVRRDTKALGRDGVPESPDDPDPSGKRTIFVELASRLFDAVGEGICLCEPSGEPIWSNPWFDRLPRAARESVLGFAREAGGEFAHRASGTQPEAGTIRRYEFENPGHDSSYEVELSPLIAHPDPDPSLRIVAIVRDVTARVTHRRRLDAIDRAGAELAHFDPEQIRSGTTLGRLETLESKIVRFAHELLEADHFSIRLLDRKSNQLESVFAHGMPEGIREVRLHADPDGNGICGYVASSGRTYLCRSPREDPMYLPGLEGAETSLTVPLLLHDEVVGVLDIESCRRDAFTDEDRQVAEIFARHIALALHVLDLLLVQRTSANQAACGRVEGELTEPLEDILAEAESMLAEHHHDDPATRHHLQRIKSDVEAIRRRMRDVAEGPQTLLGIEQAMAQPGDDPLIRGLRVLVADDEAKIRRVLGDVLRHRGAEVTLCENGQQAVEAIGRVERHDEPPFDLVLSDIKMPDRNGYEVFSAVRRTLPGVPVILMTGFGYDPHHSIVRASQEGLQAVLFKPFQVERLIEELHKAVRREHANH